jgi:hypothetical protein
MWMRILRQDPNLWLERSRRNRYETDQIHVLQIHESFSNFPPLINGSVHGVSLGSICKPRATGRGRGVRSDVDLQPWIQDTDRAAWQPRTQACYGLSEHEASSSLRWGSVSPVRRRRHEPAGDNHLRGVVWITRELGLVSALMCGRNHGKNRTKNLQEMALLSVFRNIGSSRPSRPANCLRSAFPIFMPGRPFTLKSIGSDGLKSHCLSPCV